MAEISWEKPSVKDKKTVAALFLYQYGVKPEDVGLEDYDISRSRKTGRIRYLGVDGRIYATIRATDGFIVPLRPLAARLAGESEYRVAVSSEAAEYVGRGRTVFARHVVSAGNVIRPGDEVAVTDVEGKIVAVGKALLPGRDMPTIMRGKAVKTRHGFLQ